MTRTKSAFLALLAVLLSPMAANADIVEISGAGDNDGSWDIVLVEGTFTELIATLSQQVWWDDDDLAILFADSLADLLGLPIGDDIGPLFAIRADDIRVNEGNFLLAAYVDSNGQSQLFQGSQNTRWNFAIATRVPEPGTLVLVGMGLLGMGAARRRKKA